MTATIRHTRLCTRKAKMSIDQCSERAVPLRLDTGSQAVSQRLAGRPCPAERLPLELLQAIFRLAIDESQFHPNSNGRRLHCPHTALLISWTCLSWRVACIADPEIWRNIVFESPNLTRLLLHRSKSLSIRLHIPRQRLDRDLRGDAKSSSTDAVTREALSRSRTLSVELYVGGDLSWMATQEAPSLEELRVSTTNPAARMQKIEVEELFAGRSPKLHTIDFHGCYLPWRYGLYKNLRNLKLSGPSLTMHPGADVLIALADSPDLETLELWFSSAPGHLGVVRFSGHEAPKAPLPLIRLRHLALRLPFHDMHYILSALDLSGADALRTVHIAYPSGNLLSALSEVRRSLPNWMVRHLRALRVARAAPGSFEVVGMGRAPRAAGEYTVRMEAHCQRLLKDCAALLAALSEDAMPSLDHVVITDDTLDLDGYEGIIQALCAFVSMPLLTVNGRTASSSVLLKPRIL